MCMPPRRGSLKRGSTAAPPVAGSCGLPHGKAGFLLLTTGDAGEHSLIDRASASAPAPRVLTSRSESVTTPCSRQCAAAMTYSRRTRWSKESTSGSVDACARVGPKAVLVNRATSPQWARRRGRSCVTLPSARIASQRVRCAHRRRHGGNVGGEVTRSLGNITASQAARDQRPAIGSALRTGVSPERRQARRRAARDWRACAAAAGLEILQATPPANGPAGLWPPVSRGTQIPPAALRVDGQSQATAPRLPAWILDGLADAVRQRLKRAALAHPSSPRTYRSMTQPGRGGQTPARTRSRRQ